MQKIYLTENGIVKECDSIVKNCWVALTDPTNAEITQIAQQFHIDISDVRASLDEEERSRIETEDNYTLIVLLRREMIKTGTKRFLLVLL